MVLFTVRRDNPSFYHVAPTARAYYASPILYSGASASFVTDDRHLTHPLPYRTSITTANGQKRFTKSSGKYKPRNNATPVYVSALSAPDFNQKLINISQ